MEKFKFYNPKGEEISIDEFLDFYSRCYFIGEHKLKRISQSSPYIEEKIEEILTNGIKSKDDIVKVLAWKIGKIKHGDSELYKDFIYAKDWKNAEKFEIKRYGKQFKIEKMAEYIVDNIDDLSELSKNEPQKVLNELRKQNVNGLGTVYLITLLYFISKGQYPIYDRFANMAIIAIKTDKKPTEEIYLKDLPDKTSKKFEFIIDNEIKTYIDNIKSVFGDQYNLRKVDRALWVYGHLFNQKK